jgi:Zn-dependent protease
MINALMGLFNLLPIPGFDGEKVLAWNKRVYFTVGVVAIMLNALNILWPRIFNLG